MTKKDFTLIEDAITGGIDETIRSLLKCNSRTTDNSFSVIQETMLRRKLAESFAHLLRYTNDCFDRGKFITNVVNVHNKPLVSTLANEQDAEM